MCYKKIEAFKSKDGVLFESETDAITAELYSILQADEPTIDLLLANASPILILLKRALEMRPPAPPTNQAVAKAATVPLSKAELDADNHTKSCRARLTGNDADCNCKGVV